VPSEIPSLTFNLTLISWLTDWLFDLEVGDKCYPDFPATIKKKGLAF
jgi:hypothetical protein